MKEKNNKNIWFLGGSSFFNDIGSEMITPILPFYILSLGGSGIEIGLLAGLRDGLSSIFKLLGGYFSDRFGKKKIFVFIGYIISAISRLLLSIFNSSNAIIGLVSLERFGKLRDAPRDVIISESMKQRGKGFGIHQMLDDIGGVIGIFIVITLLLTFGFKFKTIIIIATIISLFAFLPLVFVKEKKSKEQKTNLFTGIKTLDKKIKYFIFISAIFTLGNFGVYMFMILKINEISGSLIVSLLYYCLFNIFYAIFTVPVGIISDKIGRKKVLVFGYILFLIVSLSFIFTQNLSLLVLVFALFGLVYAIIQPTSRALISDISKDMKGTALGTYYMVIGIVSVIAGLIAGYLWNISESLMFSYISVIAMVSIVLILFLKEK